MDQFEDLGAAGEGAGGEVTVDEPDVDEVAGASAELEGLGATGEAAGGEVAADGPDESAAGAAFGDTRVAADTDGAGAAGDGGLADVVAGVAGRAETVAPGAGLDRAERSASVSLALDVSTSPSLATIRTCSERRRSIVASAACNRSPTMRKRSVSAA